MVRIARIVLLALAAVVPQSAALAQAPTSEPVIFHGLAFPASIAGAERFSVHDYEKDNPGHGYSAGYRGPAATSTVYIYDLRKRALPDDPSSPLIKAEFESAKGDREPISRSMPRASFRSRTGASALAFSARLSG